MVQQTIDSKFSEYGLANSETGLPKHDKQPPVPSAAKKTALRDLQNDNRNMVPKSAGSSPFLKESPPSIEAVKVSGVKRPQPDLLVRSPRHQTPTTNVNGHLVYVRRKPDSVLRKSSSSDKTSTSHPQSGDHGEQDCRFQQQSQVKESTISVPEAIHVQQQSQVKESTISVPEAIHAPTSSHGLSSDKLPVPPDLVKSNTNNCTWHSQSSEQCNQGDGIQQVSQLKDSMINTVPIPTSSSHEVSSDKLQVPLDSVNSNKSNCTWHPQSNEQCNQGDRSQHQSPLKDSQNCNPEVVLSASSSHDSSSTKPQVPLESNANHCTENLQSSEHVNQDDGIHEQSLMKDPMDCIPETVPVPTLSSHGISSAISQEPLGSVKSNTSNCSGHPQTIECSDQNVNIPQESCLNNAKTCITEAVPVHISPSNGFSSAKPQVLLDSVKSNITKDPDCVITSATPSVDYSKRLGDQLQQWEERFRQLQSILKLLDQRNQDDYLQVLRSLSSVNLSRLAVELEKRTIQLSLEEAKEVQRVRLMDFLVKHPRSSGEHR